MDRMSKLKTVVTVKLISPWVTSLRSEKFDEAMKKHKEYAFKYYSRLGLAKIISNELEHIEGCESWKVLTGDCFFQLLEIIDEPTREDGKLVVEAMELKVANNHSIDGEYLKYKVVFQNELADEIQSIIKPNDCLLIRGGRVQVVYNERILEVNCPRSISSCASIVILPKIIFD